MGTLPKSFQTLFRKEPEPLGVGARQTNHLYIDICRSQIYVTSNSIIYKGTLLLWNALLSNSNLPCSFHVLSGRCDRLLLVLEYLNLCLYVCIYLAHTQIASSF